MHDDDKLYHTAINQWLKGETDYGLLAHGVARLLRHELVSKGIEIVALTWRAKSLVSSLRKRQRKSLETVNQITDLAGVRVVCRYPQERDKVVHLLPDLFRVEKTDTIGLMASVSETGYASYHCLARWNPKFDGPLIHGDIVWGSHDKEVDNIWGEFWDKQRKPANKRIQELCCEIQVRTILQHAWAEVSREFFYGREKSIPESVKMQLQQIGTRLQKIDEAFVEEINKSSSYKEEEIVFPSGSHIDLTTAYLQEYSCTALGLPLTDRDASRALEIAGDVGIRSVVEFERVMTACLDAVRHAFSVMNVPTLQNLTWYLGAILYWVKGSKTWVPFPNDEAVLRDSEELVHREMLTGLLLDEKESGDG